MKQNKVVIHEIQNDLPESEVIGENFKVLIDGINDNLPNFNGSLWAIVGKGGSGKSCLFLSMFKNKEFLRGKFDEIHYIVSSGSFSSVKKHPFKDHDKNHFDLTAELLFEIYDEAIERKEQCLENGDPIEHTAIIIDDCGTLFKNNDIQYALRKIMNVARHANLYIILIVQTYKMIPLEIRRILTHITVFRPSNEEWELIIKELLVIKPHTCHALYKYVFNRMYNHLTIDMKKNELRKNFKLLDITE